MSKNIINIGLYGACDSMPVEGYKISDTFLYNNFAYIGKTRRKIKEMISQIVSEYPIITEDKVSIYNGRTTIERPDVEIHLYIKEYHAEVMPFIFAIVDMNIPLIVMEFDDITGKYYLS